MKDFQLESSHSKSIVKRNERVLSESNAADSNTQSDLNLVDNGNSGNGLLSCRSVSYNTIYSNNASNDSNLSLNKSEQKRLELESHTQVPANGKDLEKDKNIKIGPRGTQVDYQDGGLQSGEDATQTNQDGNAVIDLLTSGSFTVNTEAPIYHAPQTPTKPVITDTFVTLNSIKEDGMDVSKYLKLGRYNQDMQDGDFDLRELEMTHLHRLQQIRRHF